MLPLAVPAVAAPHNRTPAPRIEPAPKKIDRRVHLDVTESASTFLDSQRSHHTLSATFATFSYQPMTGMTLFLSGGYKVAADTPWQTKSVAGTIPLSGALYNAGVTLQVDEHLKITGSFGKDIGSSPIPMTRLPNAQNYFTVQATQRLF